MSGAIKTPLAPTNSQQLEAPIAAAVARLLAARDPRGWWRDFELAPGCSDEWVTGYVGSALAAGGVGSSAPGDGPAFAWQLLRGRQRREGGWGYNALTPPDADSTLWALELGVRVGDGGGDAIARGRRWLARHRRPGGGLATYAEDGPIRAFTGLDQSTSFAGWTGAHTCVTAAAARSPHHRTLLQYLREVQQPGGGWDGYWWCEPAYTTALAAEALSRNPAAGDATRVGAAVAWAVRRLAAADPAQPSAPLPAFGTAWCLYLLSVVPEPLLSDAARLARDQAALSLLAWQRPDGAWPRSAQLRVPPPDVLVPNRFDGWVEGGRIEGAVVFDQNAIFTSATALLALSALARRLTDVEGGP